MKSGVQMSEATLVARQRRGTRNNRAGGETIRNKGPTLDFQKKGSEYIMQEDTREKKMAPTRIYVGIRYGRGGRCFISVAKQRKDR